MRQNTDNQVRRLILRKSGSISLVKCIRIDIRMQSQKVVTVDGIIKDKLTENIIILGMQAIQSFGFKFSVGGQEVRVRTQQCIRTIELKLREDREPQDRERQRRDNRSPRQQQERYERHHAIHRHNYEEDDDDQISFLDPEEERMMRDGSRPLRGSKLKIIFIYLSIYLKYKEKRA